MRKRVIDDERLESLEYGHTYTDGGVLQVPTNCNDLELGYGAMWWQPPPHRERDTTNDGEDEIACPSCTACFNTEEYAPHLSKCLFRL